MKKSELLQENIYLKNALQKIILYSSNKPLPDEIADIVKGLYTGSDIPARHLGRIQAVAEMALDPQLLPYL